MAVERNPFDPIPTAELNIEIEPATSQMEDGSTASMEYDPEDGGVIVSFKPPEDPRSKEQKEETEEEFYRNLVSELDSGTLGTIATQVIENFTADKDSRNEWESMFERGFDLLGLKLEETSEPFEGACTAVHPVLIESAVKFQSKAIQELFPPAGPVRTQILGQPTDEKQQQAERIKQFMNYQLTDLMPEYFEEFERMLFQLPLIGSAFKKIYFDSGLNRPVSEFVPIDQFYVSYYATDLRRADRYTHLIYCSPVEMQRHIASGMYADVDLPKAGVPEGTAISQKLDSILGLSPSSQNDPQYVLLEQHCYLDLPKQFQADSGDSGLSLPYIVTVEQRSRKVIAIRRNYDKDDPRREKKIHFTHYRFVPGFGFYGLGLIHFLGNLTLSATAAMRALIDAGQFATLPGGFKAKGTRIVGDNNPIAPGEWKEVEAVGNDLTKMIIPLPYKEPSQTLFQMLGFVSQAAQKFADTTEQVVADSANYGPVGTTMALLEASSKFFSAIHKRLHKSQKDEFKLLARINYEYLPEESICDVPNGTLQIYKDDFDGRIDVIPVSDPNIPSNAHRMMMAQMALQLAQSSPPGMFDVEELNRTILQAANIPNLDKIMPRKVEPIPLDPVSDIAAAVKGLPIRAFIGQNHQAHVQTKMMFMQDPMNGGSPIMQRIAPVLQANIQEHMIMQYQEQINGLSSQMLQQMGPQAAQIGVNPQDPRIVEMVVAQAAGQIMQANAMAAQQQQMNSPEQQMVALEAERIKTEQAKVAALMTKENANAQLKAQELAIREAEVKSKMLVDTVKTASNEQAKNKDRQSREAIAVMNTKLKALDSDAKNKTAQSMKAAELVTKIIQDNNKKQNNNT